MDAHDVEHMLVNPFYAITISSDLVGQHDPIVSREQWVTANARLIEEIGAKAWLEKLLAVLQGDFTQNLDDLSGRAHSPAE